MLKARLETWLDRVDVLVDEQLQAVVKHPAITSLQQRWLEVESFTQSASQTHCQVMICSYAQSLLCEQALDRLHVQRLLLDEHLAIPGGIPITAVYVPYHLSEANFQTLNSLSEQGYFVALTCTPCTSAHGLHYQIQPDDDAVMHYFMCSVTMQQSLLQKPGFLSPQSTMTHELRVHKRFDGQYRLLSGGGCFADVLICRLIQRLIVLAREKIPGMADAHRIKQLLQTWLWPYCLANVSTVEQHLQYPIREFSCEKINEEPHALTFALVITPHVTLQGAMQTLAAKINVGIAI